MFCLSSGKTALHWAAAVNNVTAVITLLRHGANKDAQDGRDQTALFLAAREGSFEACKTLLDHFANRDMTDHMDRLPRDVCQEKLHHDIVKLLEEYHADAGMGFPNGYATSPEAAMASYMHQVSIKKQRKRTPKHARVVNGNISPPVKDPGLHVPVVNGQVVRLPPQKPRGNKKKKPSATRTQADNTDNTIQATSSVDHLESGDNIVDIPPSYKDVCSDGLIMTGSDMQVLNSMMNDVLSTQHNGAFDTAITTDVTMAPGSMDELSHDLLFSDMHSADSRHHVLHAGGQSTGQSGSSLGASPNTSTTSSLSNGSPLNYSPYSTIQSPSLSSQCTSTSPMYPSSTSPGQNGSPGQANQNVMSPPRRNLPLSPAHMQAMQQHQQQQQQHQQQHRPQHPSPPQNTYCYDTISLNGHMPQSEHYAMSMHGLPVQGHHQQHHYPTPPSQHSHMSADSTPNDLSSLLPDHYMTPSPDSPGQWSSSSPHSAQSDWSEGISSPPQIANHKPVMQTIVKKEAVYL